MNARVCEGTPVVDTLGRDLGRIEDVVVDPTSRGPVFFTLGHRLVPCAAIEAMGDDGRLQLSFGRDQVHSLPKYDGDAPTLDEARRAFSMLGGLPGDPANPEGHHTVPYEDTARPRNDAELEPHVVESWVILPLEERQAQGYRDEWVVGGGPGP